MFGFEYYSPTKVIFGKGTENQAGELVKAAKEFAANITLTKDGKSGDCKRIFGIMGLAVKAGNEITLTFDGEDEEAAYAAVTEFVKANL